MSGEHGVTGEASSREGALQSRVGAEAVEIVATSPFGDRYNFKLPTGFDVAILCVWKNYLMPCRLLLPHQVYIHTVKELLDTYDAPEAWIIPARSSDYLKLTARSQIEEAHSADDASPQAEPSPDNSKFSINEMPERAS